MAGVWEGVPRAGEGAGHGGRPQTAVPLRPRHPARHMDRRGVSLRGRVW